MRKEKERAAIDDQIERIARTKKNLGGNQLNTDVRAEFVKGLMQTRQSETMKHFMNNVKKFIRQDSEDEEDDERDLGEHTTKTTF